MSSKQMKTSVLLILGGHMECVKPNLSMSSCSDVRQQDKSPEGRNRCPLLRYTDRQAGSCHVGVSKRLSRIISLAVYCLSSHNFNKSLG